MKKLKTLKDLELEEKYIKGAPTFSEDDKWVSSKDLREEAIKWKKLLDGANEKDREEIEQVANYGALSFPCETEAQIRWIKYFFSITKGDMNGNE